MTRTRTLLIMTAVAALAAVVPMALMTWLSWQQAVTLAQDDLQETAQRTLLRAERSYAQALSALQSMQADDLVPCSPAHIHRMQSKVVTTSSVDQIGYFVDGRMRCTSWGPSDGSIAWGTPDHTTADGAALQLDVQPRAAYGRRMLSLRLGQYDALMDPGHFVDLVAAQDMRLAIATRLEVEEGDEDYWHSLPDDDPRAQAHDIYEWVGYLQETLVQALTDRSGPR